MVDLHNDALLALTPRKLLKYLKRAKQNGIDEIWLSVWTTNLKQPLTVIEAKKKLLDAIVADPAYPVCRLHIEDAWFLNLDNIDDLLVIKPHSVGLTWNDANNLAGGAHSRQGITPLGIQIIHKLETAGIQIDTAHLNRRSFWQFTKITTRPLLCTHTAFNAVRRHPRNLTKRQIQAIIDSHGCIGICLVPQFLTRKPTSCGLQHLLKHIMYFKKHFSSQHLCLGSDFYGVTQLPIGVQDYDDLQNIFKAQIVGYSVMRQPIIGYHMGNFNAPKRLLLTGGIHAREWITTAVVKKIMQQITYLPYDVQIIFVPNCNPDGTRLAKTGLTPFFHKHRASLLALNRGSSDFSQWKANIRGVDLNVNFDADWGHGLQNIKTPAPANYIGPRPHSEPETRALVNFVRRFQPTASLAFHSKGEIVYYSRPQDQATATQLAHIAQYHERLSTGSGGGLTDYLALKCGIPAFTIEVGNDQWPHPITQRHLATIMPQIEKLIYFFTGA